MATELTQSARRTGKALFPYLGYCLFFLVMFFFFWGVMHLEKNGAGYLLEHMDKTTGIRAESAELRTFPPRIVLSAVTLGGLPNAVPPFRLESVTVNLGIGGVFPPRGKVSLSAALAGGTLHAEIIPDALMNLASGAGIFSLHEANLNELTGENSLVRIEQGTGTVQGRFSFQDGGKKMEGVADLNVRDAGLDLPFSDPALRFQRGVRAHAALEFGGAQVSLKALTAENEHLSVQGGGTLGLNRSAVAKSALDLRFGLLRKQDAPPLVEEFPAIARLNAGQPVTIEINGTVSNPMVRVQ